MAKGLGLFGKNGRNKERKDFTSILDTFTKVKEELVQFVGEKDGHIKRLDDEQAVLALQKATAEKEQARAEHIVGNLAAFLGEPEEAAE